MACPMGMPYSYVRETQKTAGTQPQNTITRRKQKNAYIQPVSQKRQRNFRAQAQGSGASQKLQLASQEADCRQLPAEERRGHPP